MGWGVCRASTAWAELVCAPTTRNCAPDLLEIQGLLITNPNAGVVIPGTGGARKLRVALAGRGKRGGERLIYVRVPSRGRVYLLLVYPKNLASDLTSEGKHVLRRLIAQLLGED